MILIDVDLWNAVKKEFELFEALVDTGSSYCVIEKSIADALGLEMDGILHENRKKILGKCAFWHS